MDQTVTNFFERYQKENASSDVATIGSLYADTFLFAGPNGTQAVNKEDFLEVVPRMKAHFASIGLYETRLESVEATAIDSKYILAKAGWKMGVRRNTGSTTRVDAFATYILERKDGDAFSIVVQIDHQDLANVIRSTESS